MRRTARTEQSGAASNWRAKRCRHRPAAGAQSAPTTADNLLDTENCRRKKSPGARYENGRCSVDKRYNGRDSCVMHTLQYLDDYCAGWCCVAGSAVVSGHLRCRRRVLRTLYRAVHSSGAKEMTMDIIGRSEALWSGFFCRHPSARPLAARHDQHTKSVALWAIMFMMCSLLLCTVPI